MKTQPEYLKDFPEKRGTTTQDSIRAEALKIALDTRKFEIDLYWRRAAYFWAFIALAFAAHFEVVKNCKKLMGMQDDLILLSAGLGLFMSLCWYCVGKGSKYWQENWEKHVVWLEDDVIGPLYKTGLAYKHGKASFIFPTKPYPFSVSKINQLLSFAICLVWTFLYTTHFLRIINCASKHKESAIVITALLILLIILLFRICKTECYKDSDSGEEKMYCSSAD
ncbi:MAG: hypothetical protein Ta2A_19510 [Treponemataceae bacterium]|nr:MAG: hypothetical protein Ta2A_19510 [Treponemataceae bacterium]